MLFRALAGILVIPLATLLACKKVEESTPPTDEQTTAEQSNDDAGDGDDDDADEAAEPLAFEDFQETADYRTHTVIDCFNSTVGQQKKPPYGKVNVEFTIDGDGAVTDFKFTEGSTLNDEALNKCIDADVRGWKFDDTGAAKPVTHPFTFDLSPGELLPPPGST